MTRDDLVQALQDLWRAYNAVNRRAMSQATLAPMPPADVPEIEQRLALWFNPTE